jgi:hypothetical protein
MIAQVTVTHRINKHIKSCFDTSTRFPDVGFFKYFFKVNKMTTLVTTQPAVQSTAAMSSTVVENDTFKVANATVSTESGETVSAPKRTATVLLEELIVEKDTWFNNAYRTSNDQLYALLAKCYDFYMQLKEEGENSKKLREGFDAYIKDKGYKFSAGSHTLVKIVKCIFGADRRRVSAYGIVLRTALQKKLASHQVADFIRESGGVEEVRLARTNAMTAKQKAEAGAVTLSSNVLTIVKTVALEQLLDAGKIGKPVVLVGTWQSDGSIAVHACTNAAGAVNAALVSQYVATKSKEEKTKPEVDAANDSSNKDAVINKAVNEAQQSKAA